MPIRISLRHDQSSLNIPDCQSSDVTICAPTWIEEGLKKLGQVLNGVTVEIQDNDRGRSILDKFTLTETISLSQLQLLARCEERNVSGVINMTHYENEPKLTKEIIISLRDLVRQCVIVGIDETTHCGGYCCSKKEQVEKVYICDLAGLQFQKSYNSGRLVLISADDLGPGFLDELIFKNVVGEPKKSFEQVQNDTTGRYLPKYEYGQRVYFDKFAYKQFVIHDLILSALALNEIALKNNEKLHFKFLKYGTGFFAKNFGTTIGPLILPAVVDGLEKLFSQYSPLNGIAHVEFPFYNSKNQECNERLKKLNRNHGISFSFTKADALDVHWDDRNVKLATTNCADPHAPTGNEMGYSSVDAAIAQNLKSRGDIFNPALNHLIQNKFINLSC